MKKITLILILGTLISCEPKSIDDVFYHNIDLTIEKIGSDCSLSNDKFHRPQLSYLKQQKSRLFTWN